MTPPTQSGCIFPQAMVSAKGALFELKKAVWGMLCCLLHGETRKDGGLQGSAPELPHSTRRAAHTGTPRSGLCLPTIPMAQGDQHKPNTSVGLPSPFSGYHTSLGHAFCSRPQGVCHTPTSLGRVSFSGGGEMSLLQPGRDVHGCPAPGGRREQGVSARTLLCCCIAVISTEDFPLHSYSSPDAASRQGHGAA